MQWLVLLPYAAVAVVLVMAPGLVVGTTARLRGSMLVAMAPTLSIAVLSVTAIVASFLHVPWGILSVAVGVVVVAAGTLLYDRLRRCIAKTRLAARFAAEATPTPPPKRAGRRFVNVLVASLPLVLPLLIASWQFVNMVAAPGNFSQSWDNIAHLNTARWIVQYRDASSFTHETITGPGSGLVFYPEAWSGWVSLVAIVLRTTNVVYAVNACTWAVMAVVWPLSCLLLVRTLLPKASPVVRLGAGILTASFAAFPSLLVGFGVLYPNLLAFALLPAVLALAIGILRVMPKPSAAPPANLVLVLLMAVAGLSLAHPNALLSLIAMLSPIGLTWAWRGVHAAWPTHRPVAVAYAATAVVALGVFLELWTVLQIAQTWPPTNTPEASLGEFLLASPLVIKPFWLLGALIVTGIGTMVWRESLRWWIGPSAVAGFLWMVVSSYHEGKLRAFVVSGFYCDPYRLAALLAVVLVPLAAFGLDAVWRGLSGWMKPHPRLGHTASRYTAAVLLLVVLIAGVQAMPQMRTHIAWVRSHYQITPTAQLVDSDEYAVLQDTANIVPPGVRVATDPRNGSSMLYGLFGVETTTTSVGTAVDPRVDTIQTSLDLAGIYPAAVCPSLQALNVGYVLDFGDIDVGGNIQSFPGWANLATSPGFTLITQVGDAALYRIDACH